MGLVLFYGCPAHCPPHPQPPGLTPQTSEGAGGGAQANGPEYEVYDVRRGRGTIVKSPQGSYCDLLPCSSDL